VKHICLTGASRLSLGDIWIDARFAFAWPEPSSGPCLQSYTQILAFFGKSLPACMISESAHR
jgi:hypothetical protein